MVRRNHIACITTSKPAASVTVNGGGGSLTVFSPESASILSSLRTTADLAGKSALGISSISLFPHKFCTSSTQLALAYGENNARANDTYAMLLSIRAGSSPPILHWKSRLPEAQMTAGLMVSPCGYYIVGGGLSGNCYLWSSIGGSLLKTFKAHYRSCTCFTWSDCGKYLVTGGADGMVHFFSLMELVKKSAGPNSKRSISPVHTWSSHNMKANHIITLSSGRVASVSDDGQLIIMELFSHTVVASIQLPHAINCLAKHESRIFAGSSNGTIYAVDLDAFAMHKTVQQGAANTTKRRRRDMSATLALNDVFATADVESANAIDSYQTELVGHEHAVSTLIVSSLDTQDILISGDESGTIRTWDIDSRGSLSIVRPWSQSATAEAASIANQSGTKMPKKNKHPVTAMILFPEPTGTATAGSSLPFSSKSSKTSASDTVQLLLPLKKYEEDPGDEDVNVLPIPFLGCKRTMETLEYWDADECEYDDLDLAEDGSGKNTANKTATTTSAPAVQTEADELKEALEDKQTKVEQLRKELEEQKSQVERWQKVNNKLLSKLKTKK